VKIKVLKRGMYVYVLMPMEASPLPWVAVLAALSWRIGDSAILSEGDVYEGNFVIETRKAALNQEGCSARVYFWGHESGSARHDFLQSNTEARLERSAKQYCNCRYQLLSDGVLRMSCTCRISGIKIGRQAFFQISAEMCSVTFTAFWGIEGNY
jgi:hypothetical protein